MKIRSTENLILNISKNSNKYRGGLIIVLWLIKKVEYFQWVKGSMVDLGMVMRRIEADLN